MTIRQLALDDSRWGEFVRSCDGANVFHHPAWASMLSDCYRFPSFALAMCEAGGEVAAGFPFLEVRRPLGVRRWVSLPFTDRCAPLGHEANDGGLLEGAAAHARRAGVNRVEVHAPLQAPGVVNRMVAVMHTLALQSDAEAVRRTFNKSQVQRNISRAEREPVTLRRGESVADVRDVFYNLHVRSRRTQGVPVQPRRFFTLLWKWILARDLGFVLLAYHGSEPIAGAVFLTWNGTVTYKYGASNPAYLKFRPNHLIFWDAIRWSCENGYHTFDFGRSDLGNRGLRSFKNGWGAFEEPLWYSGIGGAPLGLPSEHVQRAIGRVIRRSPLWLTRALGETLYPFAA